VTHGDGLLLLCVTQTADHAVFPILARFGNPNDLTPGLGREQTALGACALRPYGPDRLPAGQALPHGDLRLESEDRLGGPARTAGDERGVEAR
jgi:hypothetical protein